MSGVRSQPRYRVWLALAAAILVAVIAAVGARAQTPARLSIKVGASDRPDQAALYLAFYRGYFAKQGLDVELIPSVTGADFLAGLGMNQIQATTSSITAALFNVLNRGIDIKIVADYARVGTERDQTAAIVARADLYDNGTLRKPADLKDRVIAAGPVRGQLPELVYRRVFAMGGLASADVTFRYLGFPDSLAALATKNIDVAFLIEPLVTQADRQNVARAFLPLSSVIPGAELSVLQYSKEFAADTDAATRFMVAYLQGVRSFYDATWLHKDEDAAISLLIEHLSLKDRSLWGVMRRNADLNGRINVPSIKEQAAFYKEQGTITGAVPDIDKFIDTRFADAAVKIIGTR
jgi:NitT/TauT family transport system substrate-binding protein